MIPSVRHLLRLGGTILACSAWLAVGSCSGGGGGSDVPNDLSGTVLTENGQPAAGTRVYLRSARATPQNPGRTWETASDARGEFHLPLVADTGSWLVEWRDSSTSSGTTRVLLSEWLRAERIPPVRLSRWGSVQGTLANGTSSPAPELSVALSGLLRSSKVDSNGAWRIEQIPEGSFRPVVEGIPSGAEVVTETVNILPATQTVAPAVVVGATAATLVWRALLLGPDRLPVAGIRLRIVAPGSADTLETKTFSDDSGRIVWIPSDATKGTVVLRSDRAVWTGVANPVPLSTSRSTAVDTLRMTLLDTLRGTMLPAAGPGVPLLADLTVFLESLGRSAKVGSDGNWSIPSVPLGTWKIQVLDGKGNRIDSLTSTFDSTGFAPPVPRVSAPLPEYGWSQLRCLDALARGVGGCLARTYPDSALRSFSQGQRTALLEQEFSWQTTADSGGQFLVARQSRQPMHLTVLAPDRRRGAFLAIPSTTTRRTLPALDTVRNLKVALDLPSTAPPEWALVGFRLVLVGTGRSSAVLRNRESAVFDSLPPGAYTLIAVPVATDAPLAPEWNLQVGGRDLDTLISPTFQQLESSSLWKTSGEITLESPQDAPTVRNMPVRVVLDGQVDHSAGKSDGADLRIFQANGDPARFWVSSWDPATARAEAWILVDSLAGGQSLVWSYRQGNPGATRLRRHHVDSVFLAREWLALWDPSSGKSLLASGNPFLGDWIKGLPGPLGSSFELNSGEYLEAAVPMVEGDSGFTFLASFRFDTLPPLANLVRISSDSLTRSLAMDATSTNPMNHRLVLGERGRDTLHAKSDLNPGQSGFYTLPTGMEIGLAVGFRPSQTSAQPLRTSGETPPASLVLATPGAPAANYHLEIGKFEFAGGFAGGVTFPRLSRGALDPARLNLEAFNLQPTPSWIRVVRHDSVTGQSKNP